MRGPLFAHADDDQPLRLYIEDESAGRRVPIELRMDGRVVVGYVVDTPEFEEPPLPETPPTAPGDPRRSPIDADDFRDRSGALAAPVAD